MTVAELIEELKAFDPGQPVAVYASYRPLRAREPIPETHRSRRAGTRSPYWTSDGWVPMAAPYGILPRTDEPFEEKDVVFL